MPPGEKFVATVRESADGEDYVREDFCAACWETTREQRVPSLLGSWQGQVSPPAEKKKVFIDDDLLVNFFARLAQSDTAAAVNLRFVLALILMRKKLLIYDRMEKLPEDQEVWLMHFKGSQEAQQVINPNLNEEKIAEVSGQLGQIMEGQL